MFEICSKPQVKLVDRTPKALRCPRCGEPIFADVDVSFFRVPLFSDGYLVDDCMFSETDSEDVYCDFCGARLVVLDWEEMLVEVCGEETPKINDTQ